MVAPLVTIAVPSFNQGRYLDKALSSIFAQEVPVEVYVLDGGSTDESLNIVRKWAPKLAGWRSHRDEGQAAAVNEGIARGRAPYVAWLNSDDWYLDGGLAKLVGALEKAGSLPAIYGRTSTYFEDQGIFRTTPVEPFSERRLAIRCIVSQPATLIRRAAWQRLGGLDARLHMALDYDLWWRLYRQCGPMHFLDAMVAVNREHAGTKTVTWRRQAYLEGIRTVRKHFGTVPLRWWLAQRFWLSLSSLVGDAGVRLANAIYYRQRSRGN
jgi:glycosyltransferase involved in cell wall biosynthesis